MFFARFGRGINASWKKQVTTTTATDFTQTTWKMSYDEVTHTHTYTISLISNEYQSWHPIDCHNNVAIDRQT